MSKKVEENAFGTRRLLNFLLFVYLKSLSFNHVKLRQAIGR